MTDQARTAGHFVREEVEIVSGQLVEGVKHLIEEGNVRRLVISNSDGEVILEAPLTKVVVGSGVAAAILAAVGGVASLLSKVRVEIQREEPS
ncbi:MAG: DUF4342 domain-containing protein [Anaerolineae bacterium]|nr:MAG: DUF4342 domain-containing protein [Anaerolineae bacterium]MCL4875925.1 DUF4342 domain-containing protein [Anaerolineae bacterium]